MIVAIILAYLAKTGNARHFPKILLGTGAAIAISVVAGIVLIVTVGGLEEPYEQIFEGLTMLLAAAVVTWMLFWMRRQAASVRSELHESVDRALTEGSLWGLALLAFTAVIREGVETSLFLVGQIQAANSNTDAGAASVLLGAVIGLAIAVVIGYGFYSGARLVNLQSFFRWTGIALIFIAAGLLSHAVHEFIEVGVITFGTQTAFDLSGVLPHDEQSGNVLGQLLRALFGYTATPEVTTLLVHVAYVVVVLVLYLRPVQPSRPVERREVVPQS
ncbi:MAG: FTR1 family protein [Chloroflexi bacterium]|nr:FTR1 family protein [Chloroflexota bacterium]